MWTCGTEFLSITGNGSHSTPTPHNLSVPFNFILQNRAKRTAAVHLALLYCISLQNVTICLLSKVNSPSVSVFPSTARRFLTAPVHLSGTSYEQHSTPAELKGLVSEQRLLITMNKQTMKRHFSLCTAVALMSKNTITPPQDVTPHEVHSCCAFTQPAALLCGFFSVFCKLNSHH